MYKCLVSSGCSFAHGFNLKNRDKRYAKLIADHIKVELIDVSAAGVSNDLIAAATVSGITRALSRYTPEEIIVLVGWTTTERFEYYNKEQGRVLASFVNLKNHKHGSVNEQDVMRSNYVSENLWDPSYGYYKLVHAFNYVYSVCKAYGIKCIHKKNLTHYAASFPKVKLRYTSLRNEELSELALAPDALECLKSWSKEVSFQEFTMKKGYVLIPKVDTHPNEQGNFAWATKLIIKHKELNPRSK